MMMFYGWSAAWFQVHHQASVSRITNRGKTGVLGLGIIASARYAKLRGVPARFAGRGSSRASSRQTWRELGGAERPLGPKSPPHQESPLDNPCAIRKAPGNDRSPRCLLTSRWTPSH
jgi:hypothetical protein